MIRLDEIVKYRVKRFASDRPNLVFSITLFWSFKQPFSLYRTYVDRLHFVALEMVSSSMDKDSPPLPSPPLDAIKPCPE